jgi:lipopolysaccharide transport system ATP-binding protein
MSDIAIRVENLSKLYRLGASSQRRYDTLRDAIVGRLRRTNKSTDATDLWALRDVSFEVQRGEVLGIIGRNGAGKSTLLKILSRITEPTEGHAEIHGRVGSLLEVGTGFHPELTGRENIYLNGAILGMHRLEIERKFDEIVAFAETEKFLDTPVKRYSSGMYVRLAFAVAAHLEPEILLVDEVLAVGDIAFQRKCLGKMEDVSRQGRTVLFVSHNMASIQALCTNALLFSQGRIAFRGPTNEVVAKYQQSSFDLAKTISLEARQDRQGDGSVRITALNIENTDGSSQISPLDRLRITIRYSGFGELLHPCFLIGIYDHNNTGLLFLDSDAIGSFPERLPASGEVTCVTGPIWLAPRHCLVNVAVYSGGSNGIQADYVQGAASFDVMPSDLYGTGKLPPPHFITLATHEWSAKNQE